VRRVLRVGAFGLLVLTVAPGCVPPDSFRPVTTQGTRIASLFTLVMVLSALVFLLVAGLLVYFVVRYRGRAGDEDPAQVEGNRKLEIFWTATPALLLAVIFVLTLQTMSNVDAASPSALRIRAIGHQWWWEYQYADLGVMTANELHVPVGVPLQIELEGADVIHSFWVPQFGWKKDMIPGKTNVMWVQAEQPGVYDGVCTEYCGTQHAWMRIRVLAEPSDRFDEWIAQQRQQAAAPQGPAARGQQVFLGNTCVNCHAVGGTTANARVGPDLTHVGSRTTIGAGVVENTPDMLRQWVRNAHDLKPGVLMPAYNSLSDDDLAALVQYLTELK
jgi:cytochrome c oxidase subunit II